MSDSYEIYAVRYARNDRPARENFLGGDPHDTNMPLDYYVWAIVGENRTIAVDTGFTSEVGARRGREMLRPPVEGLKAIGVDPEKVDTAIMTHMHYDHAGDLGLYPNAHFHLQDQEMDFCTGRCMCHEFMRHPFEVEDVVRMVRRVYDGGVTFHDGAGEIAPGVTVHHVGGHSKGLQVIRVRTKRGWVVLAGDATHLYANMEQGRPFPTTYNVGDSLEAFRKVRELADSPAHIVPGHDPDVLRRYPSPNEALKNWVVRLDAEPTA